MYDSHRNVLRVFVIFFKLRCVVHHYTVNEDIDVWFLLFTCEDYVSQLLAPM